MILNKNNKKTNKCDKCKQEVLVVYPSGNGKKQYCRECLDKINDEQRSKITERKVKER